jgi:hypothetical protein
MPLLRQRTHSAVGNPATRFNMAWKMALNPLQPNVEM